ncbi:hypothetical protein POM88_031429 [Heracleum sosnowskyi]|uniref:Ubiquitin-like protease family profile domain-containing protein n=1 Tax=Heracleum sosnowskyi TaxID=360622 RepID=A0AAD8HYU0_9APIA|nr:hypothetical protein POM88_031429 [Heracleum sosnowskyi]
MVYVYDWSSIRRSRRLRKQSFGKTSYGNPFVIEDTPIDDQINGDEPFVIEDTPIDGTKPQSEDDDDFVEPPPKKGTRETKLPSASNLSRRIISTQKTGLLNPEQKQNLFQKGKKFKIRARKNQTIDIVTVEDEAIEPRKNQRKMSEKTSDEDAPAEEMENKERKRKGKIAEKDGDEEDKKKKKNITDIFKIRNSPSNLREMISGLSEIQKTWVRNTGFGRLLDFALGKIPHRLAYHVFQLFDASSRTLKLPGRIIPITDRDVYYVLGLPVGKRGFNYATTTARKNLWTSQFPEKPQYNISPSTVIDIMKGITEDNEMFKLNFLMIMSNGLIERNTTSYLIRNVLEYEIELDDCAAYNWGELLIRSLVNTKNSWPKLKSVFYPGPIIFFTIFYVDRVIINGKQQVERQIPAFKGWTQKLLKQRQAEEKKLVSFEILLARSELPTPQGDDPVQDNVHVNEEQTPLVEKDTEVRVQVIRRNEAINNDEQEMDVPSQLVQENFKVREKENEFLKENEAFNNEQEMDAPSPLVQDNFKVREKGNELLKENEAFNNEQEMDAPSPLVQDNFKVREKDWFEDLSVKAVMLMDAIEIYKTEIEAAKLKHPNDINISNIEGLVGVVIQKLIPSFQNANTQPESEVKLNPEYQTKDKYEAEMAGKDTEELFTEYQHAEIDPDELDMIELLEYIHSTQGRKDMEDYNEEMSLPSFSLGIDIPVMVICKEINKEHGDVDAEPDGNNFVTPAPKTKEERTRRGARPGVAYRSPYVRREIDLNAKYSVQDYSVWRWIIQKEKDKYEHVFKYGDEFCIRKHIATLRPGQKLYYSVIDVWSTLMNEKETYKSAESPLRLFFNIALSVAPLDDNYLQDEQYKIFETEMNHFFERYPATKIQDYQLIFFPMLSYKHYYLICLNIKTRSWEVIDNIRHGRAANKEYGRKLRQLKQHFVKYLKNRELTWFATSINK